LASSETALSLAVTPMSLRPSGIGQRDAGDALRRSRALDLHCRYARKSAFSSFIVEVRFISAISITASLVRDVIPSRDHTRVCIIGAGPGGLSMAYFLKMRGYKRVTVLESEGRVGGKCFSLTYRGRSFDIGANYVTSDYAEVLRLAKEFDAPLYSETKVAIATFPEAGPPVFADPFKVLTEHASIFALLWAALQYLWLRFLLRRVIDRPGFVGLSQHPELCRSFADWLTKHGLAILTPMFEIPITAMGYGH